VIRKGGRKKPPLNAPWEKEKHRRIQGDQELRPWVAGGKPHEGKYDGTKERRPEPGLEGPESQQRPVLHKQEARKG